MKLVSHIQFCAGKPNVNLHA